MIGCQFKTVADDWAPRGTLANRFLQDRVAMKAGSFTGIEGIPNQDVAMWVSPGPIVDRTKDFLGASDLAVVEFRRMMIEAAHPQRHRLANAPGGGIGDAARLRRREAILDTARVNNI